MAYDLTVSDRFSVETRYIGRVQLAQPRCHKQAATRHTTVSYPTTMMAASAIKWLIQGA